MREQGWFGIIRLVLLVVALAFMLSLATPDQRDGLFIVGGSVALMLGYIGLRWLIAALFGQRLAMFGRWEIK
jgi:hypothetical protein